MAANILEMRNVTKTFPGVKALDNVQLVLKPSEILVLVGENGAGKSTLMKVLTGVYKRDAGEILFKGKPLEVNNPKEAQELGLSIIHQEFNLLPHLTVAQNIYIGREPKSSVKGIIDERKMNQDAKEILDQLKLDIAPTTKVNQLSVAQKQMVEIAKALSVKSEVLVLDEPTAALTESEIEELFKILHQLKAEGVGMIYISHRLEEFDQIADRVMVMRDGQYIGSMNYQETTIDEIISKMVGRELDEKYPERIPKHGSIALEVKGLSRKNVLNDINFHVKHGEILGIAGLMGAGRTEVARAIFGADPIDSGQILLDGKSCKIHSPHDAIAHGIGYLSEDRKKDGLALKLNIAENVVLANIEKFTNRFGVVDDREIEKETEAHVKSLKVKTPSIFQKTNNLSGGNQQKVIIGKWLCRKTKVLIFDEPTRGIDVGAKYEVYSLMNELTDQGCAVIMISSELPEILGMSDRVMVMHEGKKQGELDIQDANQEKIMFLASGGTQEELKDGTIN